MKHVLIKIIDFVIYSNLFIGLCASSLAYQVYLFEGFEQNAQPVTVLIFFATVMVYTVHRHLGIIQLIPVIQNRRISILANYQNQTSILAFIAFVIMVVQATKLSSFTLGLFLLPMILSVIYMLPIFNHNRRFRDLPYTKTITVAFVWTWVGVFIPLLDLDLPLQIDHLWLILEKFTFLLAITIPFDIRDIKVDASFDIKTLPSLLGVRKTKYSSILLIILSGVFASINFSQGYYHLGQWMALIISLITTIAVIRVIKESSHDYLYSGLLDGTILLQLSLLFVTGFMTSG